MKQKDKLEEASYFLKQMILNIDEPQFFKFNFSAFTSATRSVLQYTCKEVKGTSGQSWYEKYMSNELPRFFKRIRNHNIHSEPIQNSKDVKITIPTITYEMSFSGDNIEAPKSVEAKDPEYKYFCRANANRFGDDYKTLINDFKELLENHNRNVVELCKLYLNDLQQFISKGINEGHLSTSE